MKKNRFLLLFLLCCLMAGDSLRAEEPAAAAEKDDKAVKSAADAAAGKDKTGQVIIVTARGYESLLSKTPGGVGVIDSGELSHSGAVSISNALATVPGVSKTSDSAWGSEIVIRGASRGNLVFLVDGSRLVSASDYNAQFGTIDPSSIERVEILKGPISSLYGSGTMGGVVNVITRNGRFSQAPEIKGGLDFSCESLSNGYNTYGCLSYNSPGFYVFTSGSFRDHASYRDGDGDEMENSQFRDAQGVLNLGFKMNGKNRIEIRTQYFEGWDIGIPGAGGINTSATADITFTSIKRLLGSCDYIYTPGGNLRESKVHASYQYIGREQLVENVSAAVKKMEMEPDSATGALTWTNRIRAGNQTFVAGIDSLYRTIETTRTVTRVNGQFQTDNPIADSWYLSGGLFLEDDWEMARDFTLNLGGRFDWIRVHNSSTDLYEKTTVTPTPSNKVIWDEHNVNDYSWNAHAGLTWDINSSWSTSALVARGYRAASLEERFKYTVSGTTTTWGDPDLKPEESLFFEYGLHRHSGILEINGSLWHNRLKNLITKKLVSSSPDVYELQNVDEAMLYGGELDFTVHLFEYLKVMANMAYTRGRDTKNEEDLASIPPLSGFLRLQYDSSFGLWGKADALYNASQKHVPDGTESSDDWRRLDLMLGYRFVACGMDHEIYGAVDNVFDKRYCDYLTTSRGYAFNEPGRSCRIGYRMTF